MFLRALLVSLVALVAGIGIVRADDSALVWRTVRTPHFIIHYYEPLGDIAQQLARRAEHAHSIVVPWLGHTPTEPTHIVMNDKTDSANGSATSLPYNHINVFVAAPTSLSDLSDYDDWLFDLVLHEYTHVIHLDTINGLIPRIYNRIFGKTLSWNLTQPLWFVEGLATYAETAQTSSGRGRSSLMHMLLRAAVLEDAFLTIDQVSSVPRLFPRGTIPYLYGSHFLSFIAARYGSSALRDISHAYSSQFLPYALNRSARQVLGTDYLTLYDEFHRHLLRRYTLQRDEVRARGETSSRRLTFSGEIAAYPRFLPDGRILFFHNDGVSHPALRAISPRGGEVSTLRDVWSETRPAVHADGRHVVLDLRNLWRTFYSYDDLYLWDVGTDKLTRLTSGLRARDPDWSRDGRTVAFALNRAGASDLAVVTVDPTGAAPPQSVVTSPFGWQIYTPSWSPDGKLIAYSGVELGGYRDLFLYDVASGVSRRLWRDRALDLDPRFSPDGRYLYFSSDRTGIYNVYAYDLHTTQLYQVTNVVNGALQPEPSPDGRQLAFIGFSHTGYDLHVMELDPAKWLTPLPYVSDRPVAPAILSTTAYPDEPYRPLETFYPRTWELGIFGLPTLVEASTSFSDVIGHHRGQLAAGWNTDNDRLSFSAAYSNESFWPTWSLAGGRVEGPRSGFVVDGVNRVYTEIRWSGNAALSLPLVRKPEHSASIGIAYRADDFTNADTDFYEPDPGDVTPRFPETGLVAGAGFSAEYEGRRRYAWSISTQEGRRFSVTLRANHPVLGSDFETTTFQASWDEFVSNPWLPLHVLALHIEGGIGGGETDRRALFAMGGFSEQDIIRSLLNLSFSSGTPLRGYPAAAFIGNQFMLFRAEYRFPLFSIERGILTHPLYFRHLHAAPFFDWGGAWSGPISIDVLHPSVGAELRLEFALGYALRLALRVGYARGIDEEGVNDLFVRLGGGF